MIAFSLPREQRFWKRVVGKNEEEEEKGRDAHSSTRKGKGEGDEDLIAHFFLGAQKGKGKRKQKSAGFHGFSSCRLLKGHPAHHLTRG